MGRPQKSGENHFRLSDTITKAPEDNSSGASLFVRTIAEPMGGKDDQYY